MRMGIANARKVWSAFLKRARRFGHSPWMSVAAATAVVLGTAGTYVSGNIAADTQACDFQREILRANGSPDLTAGQDALMKLSEARTYLTLALGTLSLEQRREYAFLGVTAANVAIMSTPSTADTQFELLKFPTNEQLASLRYMVGLSNKVNGLDVPQLVQTLKTHDRTMQEQLLELAECDYLKDVGAMIGGMGLLLTLLSLTLIGFREYHQVPKRPRRRSDGPSA